MLLQAKFITGPNGTRIGALLDLASTDDYVTHSYAKKHNLHGEFVLLSVSGIRAVETQMETKIYSVPINVGQIH